MKKTILGGVAAAMVTAGIALAGPANAVPMVVNVDPVSDGAAATCHVFAQDFTGNVANDAQVALGVTLAQAAWYHITPEQSVQAVNQQVANYCPRFWPNLVAIGNAARGGRLGGGGSNV
jgi:hypothetical protein